MPTMKIKVTDIQKEIINSILDLFLFLPNPELINKKDKIMEIVYDVLNNKINNGDLYIDEVVNLEIYDEYDDYIIEQFS